MTALVRMPDQTKALVLRGPSTHAPRWFHNVGAFAADVPDFNRRLRASPHFATGLARLKDAGILGPHAAGSDLRDIHVGRVLTLGMFLGEVGGQDRASISA